MHFALLAAALAIAGACRQQAAQPQRKAESVQVAANTDPQEAPPADQQPSAPPTQADLAVPDWAVGAIFYQLFPERFHNGDPANDPTRESLEFPDIVPASWAITPWTSDWYARAAWEKELGDNFYDDGVFHRRYGGDLQGVLDKIDYLEDLGVNAIYFNPVFHARSLHKYDGASYHHIDPYFGPDPKGDLALIAQETSDPATWKWTAADRLFLDLLKQFHKRGMRVIVDGVFNHTGRDFFAFADLRQKQQESAYTDWYIVQSFDDPKTEPNEFRYKGWWGVDTLPEFADSTDGKDLHPGPKEYVFDATRRWMDPNGDGDPTDGIDGWRLDVANEVPVGFWADWNRLVFGLNPQAYTVTEIWQGAGPFLDEGGFSATMNYFGFAFPMKGFFVDGTLSASDFMASLEKRRNEHPTRRQHALQNLVDSHDTDRVASMIVNAAPDRPYLQADRFDFDVTDRSSPRHFKDYQVRRPHQRERSIQRLMVLFQMTYLGAPMLYYGDEAGMWGADDPCDRMPMLWPELTYDASQADPLGRPRKPDPVGFAVKLHAFHRSACKLRNGYKAFQRGEFQQLVVDDAAKGLAFRRSHDGHALFVAFNRGDKPWRFTLPLPSGGYLAEVFTASGVPDRVLVEQDQETEVQITLPPLDAAVLRHIGAGG